MTPAMSPETHNARAAGEASGRGDEKLELKA